MYGICAITLARYHGRGFKTITGFLLSLVGAILLMLGGYFGKESKYEEHNLSDKILAIAGVIVIIISFIADEKLPI